MPRVMIKEKDYIVSDFSRWFTAELRFRRLTQEDAAKWFGISQQALCHKIKNGSFTIRDLVTIFDKLGTAKDDIGPLLKKR